MNNNNKFNNDNYEKKNEQINDKIRKKIQVSVFFVKIFFV